jgi:hypothetical protein
MFNSWRIPALAKSRVAMNASGQYQIFFAFHLEEKAICRKQHVVLSLPH